MADWEREVREAVAGAFAEHCGPRLDVLVTEVIEAGLIAQTRVLLRELRGGVPEVPSGWAVRSIDDGVGGYAELLPNGKWFTRYGLQVLGQHLTPAEAAAAVAAARRGA